MDGIAEAALAALLTRILSELTGTLAGGFSLDLAPAPAAAPPPAGAGTVPPAPPALAPLFQQAAAATGLSPALLQAVALTESGDNPAAVSDKGAIGLMQLMPATARALGVDPYNPAANVLGGARYLAGLLQQFGGSLPLALAAYNAGPGAVEAAGGIPPFPETEHYVTAVLDRYRALTS
ncbi:MAG: lytic transglycosylase domain-containing protein [Firmicutes bacterium]|nr:lytic transglycosylase domain-containing protein [Bacillota bacterium]